MLHQLNIEDSIIFLCILCMYAIVLFMLVVIVLCIFNKDFRTQFFDEVLNRRKN